MTTSNLTRFENNGIELLIDTNTGDAFYPGYNSLARVCSIGLEKPIHKESIKRTIEQELETVTSYYNFEAEIDTTQGLRTVTIIPRQLGLKAIRKYNESLYEMLADAGHLLYLHRLVGYKDTEQSEKIANISFSQIEKELLRSYINLYDRACKQNDEELICMSRDMIKCLTPINQKKYEVLEQKTIEIHRVEPLVQFIIDTLEITNCASDKMSCNQLYDKYCQYIVKSGDYQMSRTKFVKEIQKILHSKNHGFNWKGAKKNMKLNGIQVNGLTGLFFKSQCDFI